MQVVMDDDAGPVFLIEGAARSGRDPGASLEDLPSEVAAVVAAWWAEAVGGGETRAERWQRLQAEQAEPAPDLAALRAQALERIDAEAERERLRYLTPGAGQALEYQATAEEALALQAEGAPEPDPQDYPMLAAEQAALAAVGTAATLEDVAGQVLAERAAWSAIGAAIKSVRRGAKLQAEAAESAEAIEAIFPLAWPAA